MHRTKDLAIYHVIMRLQCAILFKACRCSFIQQLETYLLETFNDGLCHTMAAYVIQLCTIVAPVVQGWLLSYNDGLCHARATYVILFQLMSYNNGLCPTMWFMCHIIMMAYVI
jgi:hypothetical protein